MLECCFLAAFSDWAVSHTFTVSRVALVVVMLSLYCSVMNKILIIHFNGNFTVIFNYSTSCKTNNKEKESVSERGIQEDYSFMNVLNKLRANNYYYWLQG